MSDERAVYRPAALERLRTADELDELLRYTPARTGLVLAAVGVVVAAALAWGALARVPLRLEGEGYVVADARGVRGVLFVPATPGAPPRPGMPVRLEAAGSGPAVEGTVVRVLDAGPAGVRVEATLAAPGLPPDSLPARGSVTVGRVRPLSLLVPRERGGSR